ncbi:MAG: hypothetical protein Q7S06_03290 [Nanoarchaeota archaeon]|nr:hypothetical protein [Nanoarchaeota archaeon]
MIKRGDGNIPVLYARGKSIPEAWENSIVRLYQEGLLWNRGDIKDQGKPVLDSSMTMIITNPDSDLFFHKYMIASCRPEDLFAYQMEILGAKDSWVHTEPGSTKWSYHYHERLADYPGVNGLVDQIQKAIDSLAKEKWKKRQNIITWVPERDFDAPDPPCLQSLWFSIVPDELTGDDSFVFNMNYRFRTRNVMIASPMNMIGLNTLDSYVIDKVKEKSGIKLRKGRIVDSTDTYHVSGQYSHLLSGFIEWLQASKQRGETIEDRCLTRESTLVGMNKEAIMADLLEQTKKELVEKREYTDRRFEEETAKVRGISEEVSRINGY